MTKTDLQNRVKALYDKLKPDLRENYGLNEIHHIAIQRVREELECHLEEDLNNPYGNGPQWSSAVLTLFNSIYR